MMSIAGIDIFAVAVLLAAAAVAPTVIVTIKWRRIPSVRLRKASSRRRIMGQHRYRSESFSPGCRVRHDQQRVRTP
jgi:hypothetical protein